jgi:hypothetical protein
MMTWFRFAKIVGSGRESGAVGAQMDGPATKIAAGE